MVAGYYQLRRAAAGWLFALVATTAVSLAAAQSTEAYVSDQALDDTSRYTPTQLLLKLFDATSGLKWTKTDNWFQHNQDICTWYGIRCYDATYVDERRRGHIQSIDLPDNNLIGTVPTELWQLPYLESVDFKDNDHLGLDLSLSSSMLDQANFLTSMSLSRTLVQDISGVSKASQLQVLHLTGCGIRTTIPDTLYSLTSLVSLFANRNHFQGSISTLIGRLSLLQDLYLYDNDMTGSIPTQIGMLTSARTIGLGLNLFEGTLPTELDMLTELRIFAMQRDETSPADEGMTGSIPSFRNAYNIELVELAFQQFSGSLPDDFLLNAPSAQAIEADLASNKISGSVPTSLLNKKYLTLYLSGNAIDTVDASIVNPSLNTCPNIATWMNGAPATDCQAWLCPPETWAPLGRATLEQGCMTCGEGSFLWGQKRCEVEPDATASTYTQREILINFYNRMGGRGWKRDGFWLDLTENVCEWQGITCNPEGKVTSIDMSDNSLSGKPPQELFTLPNLKELYLNNNPIDFDFNGIGAATGLEVLDVSHTGMKTSTIQQIDKVNTLGSLRVLSMESNLLDGSLPQAVFSSMLTKLETLNLGHNKFTGSVPTAVGNLTSLKNLDLSDNILTGSLPTELGKLFVLQELNLFDNHITGSLPTQLESLTKLRKLTLHQRNFENNGISGPLLAFANSPEITLLQLEANKLSGPLPTDFLLAARKGTQPINVILDRNELEGSVPTEWMGFSSLYIELTDNRITNLPTSLCDNKNWMGGDVGQFGCSGLLCPAGKFNDLGRQTSADNECRPCSGGKYLGATECASTGENVGDNSELDILQKFFLSTNGNDWKVQTGWSTSQNYCKDFYGVYCDGNGKVIGVDLTNNGLTGSPDSSIFNLPNLEQLILSSNVIQFSFEGISKASNLYKLALRETGLLSVEGIQQASKLVTLDLHGNYLKGTVPNEILSLTGLHQLILSFNQISGLIPSGLSFFKQLEALELQHNLLTGALPVALGDMTSLLMLNLAENNFESSIPDALNSLINLRFLSLQREGGIEGVYDVGIDHGKSSAGGAGLTGPVPAFDKLPHLRQLFLGLNSLSGPIPFNLLNGVDDKSERITVDLTNNRINGTIPASLTEFDRMSFYVQGNLITGIADGICTKSNWFNGTEIEAYKCDAILCPVDNYSKLGRSTNATTECKPCEDGTRGILGSFDCLVRDEQIANSERSILEQLYQAMGGEDWSQNTNWMDPDVSICEWYGIKCKSAHEESVVSIRLVENGLRGQFPTAVYQLPNLRELNLKGNAIDMSFIEINIAHSLFYLDLEATNLTSLDGIENAVALELLRVDNNRLTSFPQSILSMVALEVLSMSGNNFAAQPMPSAFANFINLVYFGCSGCRFAGQFPSWLVRWQKLEYLDLSQNSFVDVIPSSVQSLPNLKHLDLSDQFSFGGKLSGLLPSFSNQTKLSELLLHHNSLTGNVPDDLLSGLTVSDQVTIDLRGNLLGGSIPSGLAKLTGANLLFAMNMITVIPQELCNAGTLNNGNVAVHKCDGILCNKGTFNAYGRAVDGLACMKCEAEDSNFSTSKKYFGATTCGALNERNLMRVFFSELDGPNWNDNTNWIDNDDHCTWAGIECYENGQYKGFMKSIKLANNNLKGKTTVPLVTFEGLTSIDLHQNDIDMDFGGIANAINLETLILSQTNVSSLDGIQFSNSLRSLHATNAKLSGTFLEELFTMTNLKEIYLNFNGLTGTLPTTIGNMKSLTDLFLFENKIEGQLPTELGNLISIEHMSLGNNTIYGTIPPQLMSLPNLRVLSLQNERGNDPNDDFATRIGITGNVPAFDGLSNIEELYVGSNSLEGSIPSNFLAGVKDKSKTITVDFSHNLIDGDISGSLAAFDDLIINAEGNLISGIPAEICSKSLWMNGEVAKTCDAILCKPGTYNEYGKQTNSRLPCQECPYSGSVQYYGSTYCGPTIDDKGLDDRSILFKLYDATNGGGWVRSDKWKSDSDSVCDWFGITCGPANAGERAITKIDLGENGLQGTVPSIIFHLSSLQSLNLHGNNVSISFKSIGEASVLQELRLEGTNVDSLDGIGKASSLTKLYLQENRFVWQTIPDELYDLTSLVELDLSNARFAGTLSNKIGNLAHIETLRLQSNNFDGQIPNEIAELTKLNSIILSDNNFFGTLPPGLDELVMLEEFFLNNANRKTAGISGSLPSFANAPALRWLVLSSNSFTGTIPNNFLDGVSDKSENVVAFLDSNHLVGTLPSELAKFSKLDIDVTDNLLVGIGDGLCSKSDWSGGNVGKYNCNGIMCPGGQYSPDGRQTSAETECKVCPEAQSSPYFGSSLCVSVEKQNQRDILKALFEATGGNDWKKKEGWMSDSIDICNWEGISCVGDSSVESILLGGNNLVGIPPKEIFNLPDLKFLWLYSNPIQFSFEGIENAKSLTSLLIDSTGLTSLNGIGKGVSLVDVDVRFNKISGSLPDEIGNLYNLESFSCSANEVSGSVPSFFGNPKLNTLHMGSNKLNGSLPSFARLSKLKSIDLSENEIEGPIPDDFLNSVDASNAVFVDLSDNVLTGTVASNMARIDDLTLYLRGNKIEGISPALCTQKDWNDGDIGSFACDGILCPAGTYSPNGRASKGGEICELCGEAKYFGSTTCGESSGDDSAAAPSFRLVSISLMFVSIAVALAL